MHDVVGRGFNRMLRGWVQFPAFVHVVREPVNGLVVERSFELEKSGVVRRCKRIVRTGRGARVPADSILAAFPG